MPLYLYRSNRTERLVQVLCNNLGRHSDPTHAEYIADPFVEIPIVTGSRGMQRWIKHQVATHRSVAARLAFPFPQPAFDGAAAALLGETDPRRPFWQRDPSADAWSIGALTWRLLPLLRRRINESSDHTFDRVRRYLSRPTDTPTEAFTAREIGFAGEVAAVLDGILRQRPETAHSWLSDRDDALPGDDRWLAALLADTSRELGHRHRNAADRFLRLQDCMTADVPRHADVRGTLHVFGLSTLPRQEIRTLCLVSRAAGLHVHLYMLAPSRDLLDRQPTRAEHAAAARSGDAVRMDDFSDRNPLLADLGRPSRDLQILLDEEHSGAMEPWESRLFEAATSDSTLGCLQRDILDALGPRRLPDGEDARSRSLRPGDASVAFHPCWGPLRQVEELRQVLLQAFHDNPELQPRDVLVMTPDIATYAPLVTAVFGRKGVGQERVRTTTSGQTKSVTALPAIPVDVADLGLRATNAVADVLLTILELATDRLTLSSVLGLLGMEPVRRRFGLSSDDAHEARRILEDAGFRWGVDADDRTRFEQPRLHQNTLAFAMERTALGVLFLDETDCDDTDRDEGGRGDFRVLHADSSALGADADDAFVPFDATNRDSIAVFGRVNALLTGVMHHCAAVREPTTMAGWRERFRMLLRDLSDTTDAASWLNTRVLAELDALVADARTGGVQAPDAESIHDGQLFELDAVRSLLQGRFDLSRGGDRPISGAVTVCALEPMRSVPFKVVALLGMDDGAFPRAATTRAWDPMGRKRKTGEHDRRDIDRHLLLEALLSARDQVAVFWNGFDVHTGEEKPAAVPIRELMDAIDARFEPITVRRGRHSDATMTVGPSAYLTVPGTLQPWSTATFAPDPRTVDTQPSYDVRMLHAARVLASTRHREDVPSASIQPGDLSGLENSEESGLEARSVHVSQLASALINPAQILLRTRFKLRMPRSPEDSPDREPLAMNNLAKWSVRDKALRAHAGGASHELPDALTRRLRAEGSLAIGEWGRDEAVGAIDEATRIVRKLAEFFDLPLANVRTSLATTASMCTTACNGHEWGIEGNEVQYAPDPLNDAWDLMVFTAAGADKPKYQLRCWLQLLVMVVGREQTGGRPVHGAVAVLKGGKLTFQTAPSPSRAREILGDLLAIYEQAHREPTPLFAETSGVIATQLGRWTQSWSAITPMDRQSLRSRARNTFHPTQPSGGEDAFDRWVRAAWGDLDLDTLLTEPQTASDPEPMCVDLARKVHLPRIRAMTNAHKRPPPPDPRDGGRP